MRIIKIDIPEEQIHFGLRRIKMDKLGQIVLLAGKNGSGKTRLLNQILQTIAHKPQLRIINQAKKIIKQSQESLNRERNALSDYYQAIKNGRGELYEREIENIKRNIKAYENEINNQQSFLNWNLIETNELKEEYKITPFVPKQLNIVDSSSYNKKDVLNKANIIDSVGVINLPGGTLAKIQVVQDRWFNATHQNSMLKAEEKEKAIIQYNRLKEIIKIFLDTELERNIDGEPLLFGFPQGKSNLSDGQKILLQLCLAIYSQEKSLDELVLFLDEPENHLHPAALIETVDRIIKSTKNGQIWISTHSIPLLSHFDPSTIWYIENNSVSYAGNSTESVLQSLIGDENQIGKLQDFIALPGIHALNRHAFESLFHPLPVMTGKNDPQTLQIKHELKKHLNDEKEIRILDFGCGQGRLLANIFEATKSDTEEFLSSLDYVAYDKFDFEKNNCLNIIGSIYKNPIERYFNDFSKLFAKYDKKSFDIVVMCNVLHEIDPKNWVKLFSKKGSVIDCLSENGVLLIVEDQQMPVGEKAYQKGFIVLDTPELKELFEIKESDTDFGFSDAREDGRLKAHRIPSKYLKRISKESRLSALESLHKKASDKIIEIRNKEINYKNGKIHGFWVQQYANTGLALQELQ
jgi:ABC-type multidrug transport system ATPase subunit